MKLKNPFLSIDLDYWGAMVNRNGIKVFEEEGIPFINNAITIARQNNAVIHACVVHHSILDITDRIDGCDTLINVDYHSDLAEFDNWQDNLISDNTTGDVMLNCGTWVNHVNWENKHRFIWNYSEQRCFDYWGRCEGDRSSGLFDYSRPENFEKICGWKELIVRDKLITLPDELCGVSVCLSPDYLRMSGKNVEYFCKWFNQFTNRNDVIYDNSTNDLSEFTLETLEKHNVSILNNYAKSCV